METITSVNNSYIKQLAKLKSKKYRQQEHLYLVEGDHLVDEALAHGVLEELFICEKTNARPGVKTTLVSPAVLEKLTFSKTPQPMVGLCRIQPVPLDLTKARRIFLLDQLQDPGNIGTIIRTSLAMGFDAVVLSEGSVDLYHDKLLRSMQGAHFYLPIVQTHLPSFIEALKKECFHVYATTLVNGVDIHQFPQEDKMAFILGNEGNGVSSELIALADKGMYIPIQHAESLNVAVAGAMVAFYFQER